MMNAMPDIGSPVGEWVGESSLSRLRPPASLTDWICDRGVLTERLEASLGRPVNVQVLTEQSGRARRLLASRPVPLEAKTREVILWSGDKPLVHAVSAIPMTLTTRFPWLGDLSDRPLGQTVASHGFHQRIDFEYAKIDLPAYPDIDKVSSWCRRFAMVVEEESLQVAEQFLPGFMAHVIGSGR